MRVLSLLAALMGAASTSAFGATDSKTCARGADVRTIEVISPGKVGKACDLNVVRENGAFMSTPYHANQSAGFCAARAEEIVASLTREGFDCAATTAAVVQAEPTPSVQLADAPAAAPAASETADAMEALIARSTAPTPAAQATPSEAAAIEAPSAGLPVSPPAAQQPPTTIAAAPAPAIAPAETESQVLEQPALVSPGEAEAPKLASAGPVALSPTNASALKGVRAPRPAAGRFVGAAADAKPLDAVAGEVAEERLGAGPSAPAPVAAPTLPVASKTPPPHATSTSEVGAAPKARTAEDIVKSVLAARTAAWNDGDLDAFMGVYWKDPELRFVSGGSVSKGWKETMSRIRGEYGEGPTMGRLALDNLEVDLITDDVATVIGRYRLTRPDAADVGVFTLVMKRFDGLWRIVHDHTSEDTPRTN